MLVLCYANLCLGHHFHQKYTIYVTLVEQIYPPGMLKSDQGTPQILVAISLHLLICIYLVYSIELWLFKGLEIKQETQDFCIPLIQAIIQVIIHFRGVVGV